MSRAVNISQAPNSDLSFEFFLSSDFETSISIYQNDARVYNANIDVLPHGTYNCGNNATGFPKIWTLQIEWKSSRIGQIGWADCDMNILPHDNPLLFQIESRIVQKGIRNGLINVTIIP